MLKFDTRGALRLTIRVAVAGAVTLGAVRGASADDAGIHGFLSSIFGGNTAEPAAPPAAVPSVDEPTTYRRVMRSRTLTVRLRKPTPRILVSRDVPAKPVKVSIYEDKTLRRGDAVMTAQGIRIFAGSGSWPYLPQDFVSLTDSGQLNQDTSKVLAALDRAPRG